MKLHVKAIVFGFKYQNDGSVNLDITANKEDVFEMLDEIKPRVLADYMARRMKPEEYIGSKLINVLEANGTDKQLNDSTTNN